MITPSLIVEGCCVRVDLTTYVALACLILMRVLYPEHFDAESTREESAEPLSRSNKSCYNEGNQVSGAGGRE